MAKSDYFKIVGAVTRAFRENAKLVLIFDRIFGIERVQGNEYYLVTPDNKAAGLRFFDCGNGNLKFVIA